MQETVGWRTPSEAGRRSRAWSYAIPASGERTVASDRESGTWHRRFTRYLMGLRAVCERRNRFQRSPFRVVPGNCQCYETWKQATSYWETDFGFLEFCGWVPA